MGSAQARALVGPPPLPDPDRAASRAEELERFIDDRPGKLFKLLSACGFAAVATATATLRALLKTVQTPRRDTVPMISTRRLMPVMGLIAGLIAGLAGRRRRQLKR